MDKFKECFGYISDDGDRVVYLDGKSPNPVRTPNIVKNQKYNILSFIPIVLYNQFKFFFNFFYLMITLSQFIPPL